MITKIYCGDIIPILEEKLPVDVHSLIGKFLGFKNHIFIYMNLMNNSKLSEIIKKYIYYDCFPRYKMYEKDINIDTLFEELLVENIHNIVEIHKILPLFYRKCSKNKYINSSEFKKIDNYLTNGYEVLEEYELFECHSYCNYRLQSKPIINEITHQQLMIAFLAQNIPYYVVINGDLLDLRIQVKFKEPSQTTLKKHLSKIKSIGKTYIKEYIGEL